LVRLDDSRDFGSFTSWTLGGVLQIPEAGARLRASLGTGFKPPSLFQRFGRIGTSFRGNPDLRPEESLAWEAGGEIDLPGLGRADLITLSATYFGSRVRDLINFNAAFNSLENIDRARIQGAELGLTLRPAPWLEASVAWTITDARDRATDARLPRRPRDQVAVTARVSPLPGVTLAPELLYFGRSPEAAFASYTNDGRARTARFDNKAGTILNLTATWQVRPEVALFAEGRNLTDSAFEPANGFVIPGRSVLVGTRFSL
jgi:vitamin B12 transporter